jgi:hypothetical protein
VKKFTVQRLPERKEKVLQNKPHFLQISNTSICQEIGVTKEASLHMEVQLANCLNI